MDSEPYIQHIVQILRRLPPDPIRAVYMVVKQSELLQQIIHVFALVLQQPDYQKKIVCAITGALTLYTEKGEQDVEI